MDWSFLDETILKALAIHSDEGCEFSSINYMYCGRESSLKEYENFHDVEYLNFEELKDSFPSDINEIKLKQKFGSIFSGEN